MASDRQMTANRLNALKSTGPRTPAGKTRSSRNAVTHGLTAQNVLLPHEDPGAFEELRQGVLTSLKAQGVLELQLADRAVGLLWRLRRIPTFELALFEWGAAEHANPMDAIIDSFDETDESGVRTLGRVVEALLSAGLIGQLGRYEISLHKQLYQTLKNIEDLKATRRAWSAPHSGTGD